MTAEEILAISIKELIEMEDKRWWFLLQRIEIQDREYDTLCWVWQGASSYDNYGTLSKDSPFGEARVHREAFRLWKGDPQNGIVMHLCDIRRCINPDHLELGTHKSNAQHREAVGRGYRKRVYTDLQISEMLALYEEGISPTEIGDHFGCDRGYVCNVAAKRKYPNITSSLFLEQEKQMRGKKGTKRED